jgi:hypothetical protein
LKWPGEERFFGESLMLWPWTFSTTQGMGRRCFPSLLLQELGTIPLHLCNKGPGKKFPWGKDLECFPIESRVTE